ncbi:hypothetical protein H0H93_001198 [Arthromyces matolae]|nr:hypothetical protein H0H93_001198 [Arthromyces matolae]
MARPKKYHTPEEKAAANRAKSKRSYDRKRMKNVSIGQRAKKELSEEEQKSRGVHAYPPDVCRIPEDTRRIIKLKPGAELKYWCRLGEGVHMKFQRVVGLSIKGYVNKVFAACAISRNEDEIETQMTVLMDIKKGIERCQAHILNLAGVGAEWDRAECIAKNIDTAIHCLEDIHCHLLCSYSELISMHKKEELMYQQLLD